MSEEEEYDDVWDDDPEPSQPEKPEPQAPQEAEPEQPPEQPPEPEPPEQPPEPDDIEKLRQKVKSAEGRYRKFGEDIDQMRTELEAREQDEQPEEDTAPLLPDGWTERDWEDFVADSPVEAELMQAQNQRLATLQQRLDTSERERVQREQLQSFRQTVLDAHPDYEELMRGEGEQVRAFIASQDNPLVKGAYERVYQQGTAEEVVQLVSQYKLSKGTQAQQQQQRVNASLAVPSRAPVPDSYRSVGLPDENDEDGAWDYFSDESI